MRVAKGKSPATVRYVSTDRARADRNWQGEIAEFIVFDKDLTSEQIKHVNLYLMDKYGIKHKEAPSDLPNNIPGLVLRINADNVDIENGVVNDNISSSGYTVVNKSSFEVKNSTTNPNKKVLNMKESNNGAYIQLDKVYGGKTFFIVSRLNPFTNSSFSFLLGGDTNALTDFHSGGKKGPILSNRWGSDPNRFNPSNGGATMVNNQPKDYFSTNFSTDGLTLYTLRTANGKSEARVNQISKDRNFSDRTWQGEIGEILIYDRQLSDDEIRQVNEFLMQKFGI